EDGAAELEQPREGEVRLGLDAGRAKDEKPRCPRDGVLEQGALAHPGLAPDQQRATAGGAGVLEQLLDACTFPIPADEHRATVTPACRRDNSGGARQNARHGASGAREMARDQVAIHDLPQRRLLLLRLWSRLLAQRAARTEAATLRRIERARELA